MTILQHQERRVFSSGILRLVGYGLLLLAVVNVSCLLISPELMNPWWEFQTMGAVVERIPFTLLGMVLVYYGTSSDRPPIETTMHKLLSWLCLLMAIFLMLMIPLNIYNGLRIYHQRDATADAQSISQENAIQQFKEQLEAADSKAEIKAVLQQQAKQQVNIPDSVNPQKLKTDIITNLQKNQDSITSQALAFRSQKRSLLVKKSLKWNLGSLVASILFLMIWKSIG
jgi:hypothetical protein